MAFTVTMLSWSTIEFKAKLAAKNQFRSALSAIKWGTTYFLKAHPKPDVLYGADLASEIAAALASASIAFKNLDHKYSETLVTHAKELFELARNNLGLLSSISSEVSGLLQWEDDKFLGAQVLASKLVFKGKASNSGRWAEYKSQAEQFICSCVQNDVIKKTLGGLLWFMPWNSLQQPQLSLQPCENPMGMRYMVGFGSKYPTQPHHIATSIASIKKDPAPVSYQGGFGSWFNKNEPNPNVLEGAIVGGPDENDKFSDSRSNYQLGETTTVTPAPLVGVFASLA
ncbi:hypothetical protein Patl1_14193 [Pistacia atlantica]|uniref:Uncharacterized protein n=1 Tax=Pistacia atlantica TaxID=434234 RepID=A0ACC1AU80_9ROSI|nr:hypothetical protein Patl1_14193 [Pistacia atlantica]